MDINLKCYILKSPHVRLNQQLTLIIAGEYGERTTTLEAKEVVDLIEHGDFLVYNH
jgi:hypothetical protein